MEYTNLPLEAERHSLSLAYVNFSHRKTHMRRFKTSGTRASQNRGRCQPRSSTRVKSLASVGVVRRRLIAEVLEPRTLLTTFFVNTLDDGNPVQDNKLTLREALQAAASDTAVGDAPAGSGTDIIRFEPELFASVQQGAPAKIDILGQLDIG